MGWSVNDPLAYDYYLFLIPDPTTAIYHPIVAPYVTFSILPFKAEVSATYGKDYPILTRALTHTPTKYVCPPITHEQLTLLMLPPFDEAIASVVKTHFPIALDAAFQRYKYFQEKKYRARAKTQELQSRLEWARDNENLALEKAMCVLSEMENANFLGRLVCYEDEILHRLSSHPQAGHTFVRHALDFEGPITQSGLDPTPNPHRGAPAFLTPLPQTRTAGHQLSSRQLHVAATAEAMRLTRLENRTPTHTARHTRPRCYKCKKRGHVVRDCPKKLHRL